MRAVVLSLFALCLWSCATDPYAVAPVDEVAQETPDEINKSYREIDGKDDPDQEIENWTKRFEAESREIFSEREGIVAAVNLEPGMDIADVGSGTGIFTEPFARAVGPDGTVYCVDIVQAFLDRVTAVAADAGVSNYETVLCTEKSVELPDECVDVVFTCDTYHHMAYPQSSLASIYRALRDDGELVIIDFKRIEGESREFIMGHVRAGQEVVRAEIEAAGFTHIEDVHIDGLEENYCMRFRKGR